MIKVTSLNKSYDTNNLFDNFNLEVSSHEMVAIVGESGSGKSTLLNMIGSLEPYNGGELSVDGINLKKLNHKNQLKFLRETVSFLFQSYALMEDKTVYENISLGTKFNTETSIEE